MATMNLDELQMRIEAKLIKATPRSDGKLTIYNYTPLCQYDAAWDEYTRAARGIVLDDFGNIIARPWPKFFNLNEHPEVMAHALPAEVPELATKHDGSLIIVFWDPFTGEDGRWTAITRGCWDNVQTRHAQQWLDAFVALPRGRLALGEPAHLERRYTYLFELVAPWNRIVLPYDTADMILLGAVETPSGLDCSYEQAEMVAEAIGVTACGYERRDLGALGLDDPRVTDREGYVARYSNGLRVKLKFRQYIYLHRMLTGLSIKGIWEALAAPALANAGKWQGPIPELMLEEMPEEFVKWFERRRDELVAKFKDIDLAARTAFIAARTAFASVTKPASRKEYAAEFQRFGELTPIMFAMLDNRPYDHMIWKMVRPVGGGDETFQNEDGAS